VRLVALQRSPYAERIPQILKEADQLLFEKPAKRSEQGKELADQPSSDRLDENEFAEKSDPL
jgi:hypothetical protein